MPALLAAGMLDAPILMSFIAELSVSGDIESAPGTEFLTHPTATNHATSEYGADVDVRETSKQSPWLCINAKGLVYTSLPHDATTSRDGLENDERLCHSIEWMPDITCAVPQDARKLCNPGKADGSALERLNIIDACAQSMIQRVLTSIESGDEQRMLLYQKNAAGMDAKSYAHALWGPGAWVSRTLRRRR